MQGSRPISKTKFLEGLNAENFKEMVEMAGLCNICDEVGARNFESLNTLLLNVEEEIISLQASKVEETNPKDNFDCSALPYVVTMVDLPPHEDDKHAASQSAPQRQPTTHG